MIQGNIAGRYWQQDALKVLIENNENDKKDNLIVACPGAGKTRLAMGLAKELMERDKIEKVIIIAPTDNLRAQWVLELSMTASIMSTEGVIDGVGHTTARNSVWVSQHTAFVYTYQTIKQSTKTIRKICEDYKTLVLVDEVHHAGENLPWYAAVINAFKNRAFSVVLSGTPWRSDGRKMPFVPTDEDGFVVADYAYSRRQALIDGNVVRELVFHSVVTQVETEKTLKTIHPITFELLNETVKRAAGWVSQWSYGDEVFIDNNGKAEQITQKHPSMPHRRETLAEFYKHHAGVESLVSPNLATAKGILHKLDGKIENMSLNPLESIRKVKTSKGDVAYEVIPMHKIGMDNRRVYTSALDPQTESARSLIVQAHEKLLEIRKADPIAGGIVVCENKTAAADYVKVLTEVTGEEPALVISDTPMPGEDGPNQKIESFRNSDKMWIVTVKMVSEGVDIKRLRVLAYVSNVLSELFLAQVVGRVTRWRDDLGKDQVAHVFMMAYPPLEDLAFLVDGKVVSRMTSGEALVLPRQPVGIVRCQEYTGEETSLKPVSMTTPLQRGCRALNSALSKNCWHCGSPLKFVRKSKSETETDDTSKVGTMWRGISADMVDAAQARKMQDDYEDLAGISVELIASLVARLGTNAVREAAMKYGKVET